MYLKIFPTISDNNIIAMCATSMTFPDFQKDLDSNSDAIIRNIFSRFKTV